MHGGPSPQEGNRCCLYLFRCSPAKNQSKQRGVAEGGGCRPCSGQRRGPGATEHTVHTVPALTPADQDLTGVQPQRKAGQRRAGHEASKPHSRQPGYTGWGASRDGGGGGRRGAPPPRQHPGHVGWTGSQGGLLPLSCKGEVEEAAMAASKSDRKGMEVGFPLSPC